MRGGNEFVVLAEGKRKGRGKGAEENKIVVFSNEVHVSCVDNE